jgi:putative Holliday junction resolvase
VTGSGKVLAVDYGKVRVGLALSDPDRKFAFPHATYQRATRERDAAYFRALVTEEKPARIVVGLPLHCDGREGEKAVEARAFGKWLAEITGLPVFFWDERFTTVQAEAALWEAGLTHRRRRDRRDRVAAQILLQAYLDAGCPDTPQTDPLEGEEAVQ